MAIEFNSTATPPTGKKDVTWLYDLSASPRPKAWAYFDKDVAVVPVSASGVSAIAAIETTERVGASSPVADIARTLPAATGSGAIFIFKKISAATYKVIVTPAGSDLIDGLATYTLSNQYQYVRLQDAAAGVWDIIGGN